MSNKTQELEHLKVIVKQIEQYFEILTYKWEDGYTIRLSFEPKKKTGKGEKE